MEDKPNLYWDRQAGWPVLFPAQVRRPLEHPWGKGMFVPLLRGRRQPPLLGSSDLCLWFSMCKSQQPELDPQSLGAGVLMWPNSCLPVCPTFGNALLPSPYPEMPLWDQFTCRSQHQCCLCWPSDSRAGMQVVQDPV